VTKVQYSKKTKFVSCIGIRQLYKINMDVMYIITSMVMLLVIQPALSSDSSLVIQFLSWFSLLFFSCRLIFHLRKCNAGNDGTQHRNCFCCYQHLCLLVNSHVYLRYYCNTYNTVKNKL